MELRNHDLKEKI